MAYFVPSRSTHKLCVEQYCDINLALGQFQEITKKKEEKKNILINSSFDEACSIQPLFEGKQATCPFESCSERMKSANHYVICHGGPLLSAGQMREMCCKTIIAIKSSFVRKRDLRTKKMKTKTNRNHKSIKGIGRCRKLIFLSQMGGRQKAKIMLRDIFVHNKTIK